MPLIPAPLGEKVAHSAGWALRSGVASSKKRPHPNPLPEGEGARAKVIIRLLPRGEGVPKERKGIFRIRLRQKSHCPALRAIFGRKQKRRGSTIRICV
jgi:hypothetical protein